MGRGTMDRTVAIIFEKHICINMILKETLGITHLLTKIVRKKDSPDLQVWFNNRNVENLSLRIEGVLYLGRRLEL